MACHWVLVVQCELHVTCFMHVLLCGEEWASEDAAFFYRTDNHPDLFEKWCMQSELAFSPARAILRGAAI